MSTPLLETKLFVPQPRGGLVPRPRLRERLRDAPPALLETMAGALPPTAASAAEGMMNGALRLYRGVAGGEGGRADALPLLAADALFTHAFEAQAEDDPAGILTLADRCEAALGEVAG